ncbi:MAG TPA: hypothetical protein VFV86_03760 [Nitrososphaeraceae archaeon]|nr:hypothetical protein [Nitrososphaeraceae archaeon]
MSFSGDEFNSLDNLASNSKQENNIIILKRVKSVRQLKNSDKERVRLCYKEAILKGFTIIKDIQCYIASKTKIWIERTGIEYLKKTEEEENKKWYYYLAKDHFAYVGAYRKTIDEIEQCKKDLWSMMMGPDITNMEKVQVIKELHNLTKTSVLLLRDLPFVTNLSKYYNLGLTETHYNMTGELQKDKLNKDNIDEKEIIEQKVSERLKKMVDESGLFISENRSTTDTTTQMNGPRKITDLVMEDMQKQLNCTPEDIFERVNNSDYQESLKKIKEITED